MKTRSTAGTARTWLFVPGDRPERFAKADAAGADVVVLDLEDAVAGPNKEAAREHVARWLVDASHPCAVRVNAVGTSGHSADLDTVGRRGPVLVVLPKAEDHDAVGGVLNALPEGSAVVALVETALGVVRAVDLAQAPGVVRLALGSFDLAAELGVDPDHGPALAGARHALVLASAVAGLAGPIDGVTGDVRDQNRLAADVTAAAALGFAGKLCIHPAQVTTAATALAPSAQDVAWATRVLTESPGADAGAALVDGLLVDPPVLARARRILAANDYPGALP